MDQLICASLSHTHFWYEVGMLKVPAMCTVEKKCNRLYLVPVQDAEVCVPKGQLSPGLHPLGEHEAVPRAVHRLERCAKWKRQTEFTQDGIAWNER